MIVTKKRITKQQRRRIQQAQDQQAAPLAAESVRASDQLGDPEPGLVVSTYRNVVEVERPDGALFRCVCRSHLGDIVSGDQVVWREDKIAAQMGVLVARNDRRSVLQRLSGRHQYCKTLAANIDMMAIMVSPKPNYVLFFIDQYVAAAALNQLAAMIIFNKVDLLDDDARAEAEEALAIYESLGIPVRFVSVKGDLYLDELRADLSHHRSIIVGQSGVGKSSLINALVGQEIARVGEISAAHQQGKHTTTTSRLYHLASGGEVIDSPGIRTFNLRLKPGEAVIDGFLDIRAKVGHCQYRNCRHIDEPGCAILSDESLPESRKRSYRRLLLASE